MQVAASAVGRMGEGAPEVSLTDVVIGQASALMSPSPSTTGGAALEELLPQEGSAPLGISVEPSRSLVRVGGDPHTWGGSQIRWAHRLDLGETLFALDDAVEEWECGSIHMEVGTAVRALTTALGSLHDISALVDQV